MKFLPILFLTLILSLSLVLAVRYESNNFREATITSSGLLITNNPVYNVSIEGYTCADSLCNTFSNQLFSLFTANDSIILTYPTTQSAFGYGIYAFKPGYLPAEIFANWYGSNTEILGPFTNYLAKKDICIANITSFTYNHNNSSIYWSANIISPLNHSGPLPAVPSSLSSYYESQVITNITISNGTNTQEQIQNLTLPFSSQQLIQINNTLFTGNNTFSFSTQVQDSWCINTPIETRTQNIFVSSQINNQTNNTNSTNQTNVTQIPTITIISPTQIIYNSTSILVNILTQNATFVSFNTGFVNQTYSSPTFITLPAGNHTLTAFASNSQGNVTSQVNFSIILTNSTTNETNSTNNTNNTQLPIINIISPINQTYNSTSILVNISSINASAVFFNIDNGNNQTYINPINLILSSGQHTLNAFGLNSFGLSNSSVTFIINTTSNQTNLTDNIPPASISNLTLVVQTSSTLAWTWLNPNNTDFSHVILYINGINVVNTTNQSHIFNNLNANTQYNLTAYTIDFSGNINTTGVTSIATTLSNSGSSGSGSGGSSSSSGSSGSSGSSTGGNTGTNIKLQTNNQYNANETLILSSDNKKVKYNSLLFLLGLAIIILLALILLILSRKN